MQGPCCVYNTCWHLWKWLRCDKYDRNVYRCVRCGLKVFWPDD